MSAGKRIFLLNLQWHSLLRNQLHYITGKAGTMKTGISKVDILKQKLGDLSKIVDQYEAFVNHN